MAGAVRRRDFLKFIGGAAVGTLASPLPWKLIDDISIWTQNWRRLPRLPRGAVERKHTHCTLCPAGCGLRVRTVGGRPVGVSGIPRHPVSRGKLCPLGLVGHQMSFHPLRVRSPLRRAGSGPEAEYARVCASDALQQIADWIVEARNRAGSGSIAVLDSRTGRTISLLYRRFLDALGGGSYLTNTPARESLGVLEEMLGGAGEPMGIDLASAAGILSFSVPLLGGWPSPGRAAELIGPLRGDHSGTLTQQRRVALIQVETRPSRSALLADQWLRISPGSEAALALGIANVILAEQLQGHAGCRPATANLSSDNRGEVPGVTDTDPEYERLVASCTPQRCAVLTGLRPEEIQTAARRFAEHRPAIAIPGVDPAGGRLGREAEGCIWALNFLVGSVGRAGGIVFRRHVPTPQGLETWQLAPERSIAEIPDHSIRLLIIDGADAGGALPAGVLRRKMVPDGARVVSLAPFAFGLHSHADLIVPAPAPMQALEEVIGMPDAPRAFFALSLPLGAPPPASMEPMRLLQGLTQLLEMPGALGDQGERAGEGALRPARGRGRNGNLGELLRGRADAIHEAGRGSVFRSAEAEAIPLADVGSPEEFWQILAQGGCWVDGRPADRPVGQFSFLPAATAGCEGTPSDPQPVAGGCVRSAGRGEEPFRSHRRSLDGVYPLLLMPYAHGGASGNLPLPPALAKLYRESDLHDRADQALINPETAKRHGLRDCHTAVLETAAGSRVVRVRFDPVVLPDVVHIAAAPLPGRFGDAPSQSEEGILEICLLDRDCTWRVTPARIREV